MGRAWAADGSTGGAEESLYFGQTGHSVQGVFLTYWQQHGGAAQFGYPLTEQKEHWTSVAGTGTGGNGAKVTIEQWFTKARLEYHPELSGEPLQQIELGLVGREMLDQLLLTTTSDSVRESFPVVALAPVAATNPDATSQTTTTTNTTAPAPAAPYYCVQTSHSVSGAFLDYWQRYGGAEQFGYPLTEQFRQVNPATGQEYAVQWFERARFEWHSEFAGTRYEMELAPLGFELLNSTAAAASGDSSQNSNSPIPASPVPTPNPTSGGGSGGNSNSVASPLQPHLGYGMNVWLFGQDKGRVLNYVKGAGFDWVRQQVRWSDIEPAPGQYNWNELDAIVSAVTSAPQHLKVLFSVVHAPNWAGVGGTNGLPDDPATFGTFMQTLAGRYRGQVLAYEIWNEQNLGIETGGQVDAARYVATLGAAYKAVKSDGGDPHALVLFGSLAPTGLNDPRFAVDDALFLQKCYEVNGGEVRHYFDVLGMHPGSAANSPDEFYPVDAPTDPSRGWTTDPSFYFRRVETLRDIMVREGDAGKPAWITEVGWTTRNAAPGYEYGALNTEQTQANYLVRAFQKAQTEYKWVTGMFVWQLNFATLNEVGPTDEKGPWGLLRADWSTRPAYDALKAMSKP